MPTLVTMEAEMEAASEAVINRKIDFHLESKSLNGFSNTKSNNGFKLVTLNPKAPESHTASGSTKKSERSELLETGLDTELSFRITFRRIGAGLRNLGNTCFLNSVLQCLTYTEPLAAYLQSGKHQSSCRTAGFCALCAIQKHVSRALQSTGRILEPKDLVSNLRRISRSFRNARQEDAHEYMVNLLESMHKCCLPSGVPSESASAYEKSLVHKIFGGRLRSQVKCMQCSFCSNKFDPFLDLSLEIVKAESLYKALAHFTAKEQLDGGEKQYQCQQCNQKVKALKQLTIYQAPHVLAIHLKRFDSHLRGQKINKNVSFGPTLDLKPFVTGSYDVPLRYTLYGVLVHAGWSTHSGHYYCFIRTSTGMWFCLDDNQVVQVSEKIVLGQKAYMLFYVRDGTSVGGVKKPVDGSAYSKSKPDVRQKGLSSEKIHKGSFSAALSGKAAPEEPPKPILSQHITNSGEVANEVPKADPKLEPSLIVRPSKDLVGSYSVVTTKSIDHKPDSSLVVVESGGCLNSSHTGNIVVCTNKFSILQDIDSDMKESDVKASSQDNDSASRSPNESLEQKSSDMGNLNGTHTELREEESNKIVCTEPSEKSSGEKPQEGCSSKAGDSPTEVDSEVSLDTPATTKRLSCRISRRKKPSLKVNMKKLFKYQISRHRLSSSIMFGAALCSQKKNKQRKSHSKVRTTSHRKQLLGDKAVSSGLGSPASSKSHPKAQKKRGKCVSDNKSIPNVKQNTVVPSDAIIGEFRKRVRQNDIILTNEKQSISFTQKTVISEDNSNNLKPEDIMSILTRGLEEKTVDRWNVAGVSFLATEGQEEVNNAQIGYIGDEWDEEYDRGNRKKIRQHKISFDGPNMFQEIASGENNAKRKKTQS